LYAVAGKELNLIPCTGILEQSIGARNRVGIGMSYRPARLHRVAESIPWNRFLGSKNTVSGIKSTVYDKLGNLRLRHYFKVVKNEKNCYFFTPFILRTNFLDTQPLSPVCSLQQKRTQHHISRLNVKNNEQLVKTIRQI
jgi:hypothetical protein